MENTKYIHYDKEEKIVIGTIIRDNSFYDNYADEISKDAFTSGFIKRTLEAIIALTNETPDQPVGITDISVWLEKHPNPDRWNPTDEQLEEFRSYADFDEFYPSLMRVNDAKNRRGLISLGEQIERIALDPVESEDSAVKKMVDYINQKYDTKGIITSKEANDKLREIIALNKDKAQCNEVSKIVSGFESLDERGGLQPGDLVIIAAETSQGKSSMALNIAVSAAKNKKSVAYYSLEMTAYQLAARIASMKTGITANKILYDTLDVVKTDTITRVLADTDAYPIFYDESSTSSIDVILRSIRKMKNRYDIKLVVVDYLQILSTNRKVQNNELFMGDVARSLKNIAKELGICVLALSQLNRAAGDGQKGINRIRSSGQIAEAADTVMIIKRDNKDLEEVVDGRTAHYDTVTIKIEKGRNIGTGEFGCRFYYSRCLFAENYQGNDNSDPLGEVTQERTKDRW